jgi:hypothetical protein
LAVVHSGAEAAREVQTSEVPRVMGEAAEESGDGHLPRQAYDWPCGSCFGEYDDKLGQCVDEVEVGLPVVVAGSGRATVFCQGLAEVAGSTAPAQAPHVQRKRRVGAHSSR